MSMSAPHLAPQELLAWWLHETDAAAAQAVDEHLMACDACGRTLDDLVALGQGVREAFRAGAVSAITTAAFIDRLAAEGMRVREYRLPHNGSVHCTVTPDDDLLASHVQAPLHGLERIDAVLELSLEPGVQHRLEDVPFDPQAGELVYVPNLQAVRRLPDHTLRLTLLAVAPQGSREIGRYTFHHAAHPG